MKLLSAMLVLLTLSGCASTQPVGGIIYSDVKGPVAATNRPRGTANGEACATSYLGLVAMGDASITAAANAGGVAAISHVEQHSTNILGIIHKYCTWVWGVSKTAKASKAAPATTAPAAGEAEM